MSLRLFFSLIRIDLMFHASPVLISFVPADAIIGGMIVVVFDVYQSAPWTTVERRLFIVSIIVAEDWILLKKLWDKL